MHRVIVICSRGIITGALLAVMMIALHQPSVARDRPGTPNAVTVGGCDFDPTDLLPRLCGNFNVTASEENWTEVEATRNGTPIALNDNQVFCPTHRMVAWVSCWHVKAVFKKSQAGGETRVTYGWKGLDFGAQYCFHFRARRTSDQVVSELWSAWACARTPDKPSVPVLPEFSVSFSGTQMLNKPVTATPGATAQVIPEKMQIKYPEQPTTAAALGVFVYQPGTQIPLWKPSAGGVPTALYFSVHRPVEGPFTDEYKIPDYLTVAVVQICAVNISGQKCATKNVSIINSADIQFPRTSAPVGRPGGAPEIKPVRPTGRPETAPAPVATIDQSVMAGTDLPGADYRNAALNDDNATTCKTMCATDAKCLSWTWVKPGVQNAKAMCWLKNAVPSSHPNPNATSGIKTGGPPPIPPAIGSIANAAPVTVPAPPPQIKPVRPTGRPETAPAPAPTAPAALPGSIGGALTPPVTVQADRSFMVGTDLPGSDYRNSALNDNNATTCKTMCATDAKCQSWTWVKPGVQNAKAMCWLKNAVPSAHPNPNVTSGIKITNEVIH